MWWLIIFATIITFVWWGSSPSMNGGGGGSGNFGRIDGKNITSTEYEAARREVMLMYFFASGGSWPDRGALKSGFDLERETYFRVFLNRRQQEMGVHVSQETLAKIASDRLRAMNRGKPVSAEEFATRLLAPEGLDLHDFQRFIEHELGMQQMASLLGLGGELVTPQEIRALYDREHQELQTQVAFFSASNHLAEVKPTPEQLGVFFTNQAARYRLPERLQVNYVQYPMSNFLAEAVAKINENTNLNELLEAVYQQRGTNYYSDAKSPAEAKQRILQEEQHGLALDLARKKALEFANALYAREPLRAENLTTMAKEAGLTPHVSAPFDQESPPAGLDVRSDFNKAAFQLSEDEPYSQLIAGNDGVYLISLNKRLPSEIPSLESIRDRVTQDFRLLQAVQLARQAGIKFVATATNSLAAGKNFAEVCAAAGIHPVSPPPFSLSTRTLAAVEGHVSLSQFKQAAFSLTPGHLSPLEPDNDGAFVVFLQAKLPVNEKQWVTDQAAFTRSVRQARRSEAFNRWFSQQFTKIRSEIPYFNKPPQMSGTAGS